MRKWGKNDDAETRARWEKKWWRVDRICECTAICVLTLKKIEKNVSVETRNAKHPPRSRPTNREVRALILWLCIIHIYIYIYVYVCMVLGWIGLRRTDVVFSKTIRDLTRSGRHLLGKKPWIVSNNCAETLQRNPWKNFWEFLEWFWKGIRLIRYWYTILKRIWVVVLSHELSFKLHVHERSRHVDGCS